MEQQEQDVWGCLADTSESYQLKYSSREEAIDALVGEPGVVVRCRRGIPREGLEYVFDPAEVIGWVEHHSSLNGSVIAEFESGVFNTDQVQEEDLLRRLADALHGWIQAINPQAWVILESECIEARANAEDIAP